jgi:hypothetical protein
MRSVTAKERRERLARVRRDASSPRPGAIGAVHRRAVVGGAPTAVSCPSRGRRTYPGSPAKSRQWRTVAKLRQLAHEHVTRAGGTTVTYQWPGAQGHERCTRVCLTYS